MHRTDLDVLVVGAGIVGLAVAAEAALRVRRVVVLERHDRPGTEISSRSSEVVHAGLYYPAGTLKTRLCIEGRRLLYSFAEEAGVPVRRCGKLIVATSDDDLAALDALRARGEANGVEGLRMLSAGEVAAREPCVTARGALLSTETGIVDSHRLIDAFRRLARERGADVVLGAAVTGLDLARHGWRVAYRDAAGAGSVTTRTVVNAAGLGAQAVMRSAGLDPDAGGLTLHLCKGEYFAIQGPHRADVRALVYPSPLAHLVGLGIHTVVDLAGDVRLGPNAFYVETVDYTVEAAHRGAFVDGVRAFLPWLCEGDLVPSMAGVRPKLSGPGQPARDFHIAHETELGAPGLFDLAGIESPGLTASPAIGRHVAEMVADFMAG